MSGENTSKPFYSLHCVAKVDEKFQAYREVYLLGPQFCGGEKIMLAKLFSEALRDAKADQPDCEADLPQPVRDFLAWTDANAVAPQMRGR